MKTKSLLKLVSVAFIALFVQNSFAGKFYWVKNAGTWDGSDPTHWSFVSNGSGGDGVPTFTDTVYFDKYSFPGMSFSKETLTISGTVQCLTIDLSLLPDTVDFDVTCPAGTVIKVKGGLNLFSQHTGFRSAFSSFPGTIEFIASIGTHDIFFGNGQTSVSDIDVNIGNGGTYNLKSRLTIKNLTVQSGSVLNTQNYPVDFINVMNTGIINAGSSVFTYYQSGGTGGQWYISGSVIGGDFSKAEIAVNGSNQANPFYFTGGNLDYGNLKIYPYNLVHCLAKGTFTDIMLEGKNSTLKINPGDTIRFSSITSHTGYNLGGTVPHSEVDTTYILRTGQGSPSVLYDIDGGANCLYFTRIDSIDAIGSTFYTTLSATSVPFVKGSFSSAYMQINQPDFTVSVTPASCTGGTDGVVALALSGGVTPFDVKWAAYAIGGDYVPIAHHPAIVAKDTLHTEIGGNTYDLEVSDSYCTIRSEQISIPASGVSGPRFDGFVLNGSDTIGFGYVNVFYDDGAGKYLKIARYSFDGYLYGTDMGNAGNYILQWEPSEPNDSLSATYYDVILSQDSGTYYWDSAYVISNAVCGVTYTQNIHVLETTNLLDTVGGGGLYTGDIKGHVYEGPGYEKSSITAVKQIPSSGMKIIDGQQNPFAVKGLATVKVILGKQPGSSAFAVAYTDTAGAFAFNGVPVGNYKLFIDIPGLPMDSVRQVVVSSADTIFKDLDYIVDSAYVYVDTVSSVGVNTIDLDNGRISVYPNPFSEYIYINLELDSRSLVNIQLFDMLGNAVSLIENNIFEKRDHLFMYNRTKDQLPSGIYLLRLQVNSNAYFRKIVIN